MLLNKMLFIKRIFKTERPSPDSSKERLSIVFAVDFLFVSILSAKNELRDKTMHIFTFEKRYHLAITIERLKSGHEKS